MRKLPVFILMMIIVTSCVISNSTSPTKGAPSLQPTSNATYIFTSTSEAISIGDGGLLSGKPCSSPCFLGIEVGKTPLDEIIPILERNGVSNCTQNEKNVSCGLRIFIGVPSAKQIIIDGIGFSPDSTVTLETVIEKYGNPDIVRVFPGVTPEKMEVSAQLFWNSIRMRIDLPEITGQVYGIDNIASVEWVTFFDKTTYTDLIVSGNPLDWIGYGHYSP